MSAWVHIEEDIRRGGIVYECLKGHQYYMTKEAVAAYVVGNGPDRPEECEECGEVEHEITS